MSNRISIKRITLQGFKSFANSQTITFNRPVGLYFLSGRNGHGKTTIWDALLWTLYGKSTRGLGGPNLKSWFPGTKLHCEIDLTVSGKLYKVTRTWKPNTLTIKRKGYKAKEVEQYAVDELLGLSYGEALHALVFAQFGRLFLDLKPQEKSSVLAAILETEKWDRYVDKASAMAKDIRGQVENKKRELSTSKGKLAMLKDHQKEITENLQGAQLALKKEQKRHEVESKRAIKDLEKQIESRRSRIKKNGQLIQQAEQKKERYIIIITPKSNVANGITDRVRQIETELEYLGGKCKELEEDLAKGVSMCSRCGQKVSRMHIKEEIKRVGERAKELVAKRNALQDDERAISESIYTLELAAKEADKKLNELKERNWREDRELDQLLNNLDIEKGCAGKSGVVQVLQDRVKAIGATKAKKARQEKTIVIKNKKLERSIKQLAKKEHATSFWVRGFKEVKLMVMDEALAQLELEANNALDGLGLYNWKIQFATETITKSKTVKKGFSVTILSPHNDRPVPWETWSGGETQRLRLAVQLGLVNMILNRKGISTNLLVLDEPTAGIEAQGLEELLDTLNEVAEGEGKQVWLLDHSALSYANFAGKVSVVKENGKSKIMEYNYA